MNQFQTPILFLIFNRLDTTKEVFLEIKKQKPKYLYLASDGPRKNKLWENEIVEEVRKWVLWQIDRDCDVKTLFRKGNLWCKYAVSSAIDWFFDNVEMWIILEDDCLPDQSFFQFCEELLEKYKNDTRIWIVSWYNPMGCVSNDFSYITSRYPLIRGWATWKRVWANYSVTMDKKELENAFINLKSRFPNFFELIKRKKQFLSVYMMGFNTWDYQFHLNLILQNQISLIPSVNIIDNIWLWHENATHTQTNQVLVPSTSLSFPLQHPLYLIPNYLFDRNYIQLWFIQKMRIILSFIFAKR